MATKIVLIDDDNYLPTLYKSKFSAAGYDFFVVSSPDDDILSKVANIRPDLILLDLYFKGSHRDGVVIAEILNVDERTKSIPIIFLTNAIAENEKLAHRAKQFLSQIGFLEKPLFTPNALVSKVQDLYNEFLKNKVKENKNFPNPN